MDIEKIEKLLMETFKNDKNVKAVEGIKHIEYGVVKNVVIVDFESDPGKKYENLITNVLGQVGAVHHFKYGNGYALNVCLEEKEHFQMQEGMEIVPNEWYNPIIDYFIFEFFVGNRKFHLHVSKENDTFFIKEEKNEFPLLDLLLYREAIEAHKLLMLLEGIENPLETLKLNIHMYVGKEPRYWIRNGKVEKADKRLIKEYSQPGFLSF
ncbi:hypothetical protein [Bacillus cereus group sp. TH152-1LC]|uniref:hypothetical protein n=1 Tax=Bacillus cereus group sp. TH152-1LC TaxID=3018060 RepID=UPI0022E9226E|nr:hypothetical protein [Bacillus cereus group sp. TH152-1LC]MDA1675242.1 hypothetical protein [Bacillus cereus group sp. TH152-1LC]